MISVTAFSEPSAAASMRTPDLAAGKTLATQQLMSTPWTLAQSGNNEAGSAAGEDDKDCKTGCRADFAASGAASGWAALLLLGLLATLGPRRRS